MMLLPSWRLLIPILCHITLALYFVFWVFALLVLVSGITNLVSANFKGPFTQTVNTKVYGTEAGVLAEMW